MCASPADLATAQDSQDSAGTFADVSTVMFIAGSVFAATGVVLLVVRPGGEDVGDVAVRVGPGSVTVGGRL